MEIFLIILTFVLMLIGLLGVILPFLPGVPIAWVGLFIYAYFTEFNEISLTLALVFLGLALLSMLIDFILPLVGAKTFKASRYGFLGAFLGLVFGISVGPFGLIVFPLIGAFLGELVAGKDSDKAFRSALGTFLGNLGGALIKITIILIMLGFFIASLF